MYPSLEGFFLLFSPLLNMKRLFLDLYLLSARSHQGASVISKEMIPK